MFAVRLFTIPLIASFAFIQYSKYLFVLFTKNYLLIDVREYFLSHIITLKRKPGQGKERHNQDKNLDDLKEK